jgi:hypothetical protein
MSRIRSTVLLKILNHFGCSLIMGKMVSLYFSRTSRISLEESGACSELLDGMVRLLLPWAFSPQLSFELFIHVEDNGADGTIREGSIHPEDKIPFVQMWIRATVTRPMVVDRTEIVLQKGTWLAPENRTFSFRIVCEKSGTELLNTQLKMLGKASDIRRLQDRMDGLAAVGALGAVDFSGYFPIEIMDRKINPPDREIRSLEKAAECPVGLFALLRELFNSLDVGFKFHISERSNVSLQARPSGRRLDGLVGFFDTLATFNPQ